MITGPDEVLMLSDISFLQLLLHSSLGGSTTLLTIIGGKRAIFVCLRVNEQLKYHSPHNIHTQKFSQSFLKRAHSHVFQSCRLPGRGVQKAGWVIKLPLPHTVLPLMTSKTSHAWCVYFLAVPVWISDINLLFPLEFCYLLAFTKPLERLPLLLAFTLIPVSSIWRPLGCVQKRVSLSESFLISVLELQQWSVALVGLRWSSSFPRGRNGKGEGGSYTMGDKWAQCLCPTNWDITAGWIITFE